MRDHLAHFLYNETCQWTVLLDDGVRAPAALASAAETAYGGNSRAQLPGTPDGNLAGADVHALYLAGEREAVAAGDHREVAKEPAVRTRPPSGLIVSSSTAVWAAVRLLAKLCGTVSVMPST